MGPLLILFWLCVFANGPYILIKAYLRRSASSSRIDCLHSVPDSGNFRYTVKSPLECSIRSSRLIGTNGIDRSFYHIVIEHNGLYKYEPGQYCGVIPPGISERTQRKYAPRSYSLAPVLDDDGVDPATSFSLGIRAPIILPENKHMFRDICICSQFLSGAIPGTPVSVTGPFGKFVLSPGDLTGDRNLLFIATGSGIVPYMGFLKAILEMSNAQNTELGRILLLFGVQSPDTYLYRDTIGRYVSDFNGRLTVIPCYSRYGVDSERGYVQDVILREMDLVNSLCSYGGLECSVFICGHKSMKNAVMESLMTVFEGDPKRNAIMNAVKVEVYE